MLSRETEQKLVQIFITISLGEEKIDKLKKEILNSYNINPLQFFFKLDKSNSNYLSKNDIYTYLNSFSLIYSPSDIDYIFYFYDKDFDNVLNFYEFLDILISNSNYLYKKSFKKKYKHKKFDQNEINAEIDGDIQKNVLQIFIEEIELGRQLNDLIIDVKRNDDFEIQNIFYEIKSYSYITSESLKAFFDRNEVSYNDKFIKNIFYRFSNKDINDRISFNKFKFFFDLPYNKSNINENSNININNNYIQNFIPSQINTTQISDDIHLNSSKITYQNNCENFCFNENINNINNNNLINNINFENEEDIQFQCSHLSRSGSIETKKNEKNTNCGYIPKNSTNISYKNYLRDKRSKSLEKSLSRSVSRKNRPNLKNDYNKKDIRNIRVIADDNFNNNSTNNEVISSNMSSNNEDIPVNLPERLDKNLVKRKIPQRKINNQNKSDYNFNYDKMNGKTPNNNHNHSHCKHCHYYYTENNEFNDSSDKENMNMNMNYNYRANDIISSNNLDLKVYKEDFGSKINNDNYEKYKF